MHAAVDDATGTIVGAIFRLTETQEGNFTVMRQGIEKTINGTLIGLGIWVVVNFQIMLVVIITMNGKERVET